jgi:hypothetical protein
VGGSHVVDNMERQLVVVDNIVMGLYYQLHLHKNIHIQPVHKIIHEGPVRDGPGVQSGPVHDPARSTVRSMGPHGTGPHGPFSGVTRTDPPLDRTKARHETVHGPVRFRTGWTEWVFSILYARSIL